MILGGFDGAYMSTMAALGKEELLGKLVLLQGSHEPCPEFRQLSLPSIPVTGLFMSQKLPHNPKPPGPIHLPPPGLGTVTTNGGLISPQSETHSTSTCSVSHTGGGKLIDITKVSLSHSNPTRGASDAEHWLF